MGERGRGGCVGMDVRVFVFYVFHTRLTGEVR